MLDILCSLIMITPIWNDQIFEDGSTYHGALKTAVRIVVDTKYGLEDTKFDEDRFSNQQGWWDYLKNTVAEYIDKCTYLHQGRDSDVGYQPCLITCTNINLFRVYQAISTIWGFKSSVFHSLILVPMQLEAYFLMSWANHFPTMPLHWWWWR